jgi:integrase
VVTSTIPDAIAINPNGDASLNRASASATNGGSPDAACLPGGRVPFGGVRPPRRWCRFATTPHRTPDQKPVAKRPFTRTDNPLDGDVARFAGRRGFYRSFYRVPTIETRKENHHEGIHRQEGAALVRGDLRRARPLTGQERRTWHPAGSNRQDAEKLAKRLAAESNGRNDASRSLTFGAFLTQRWLPAKRVQLRQSTWDGYRRKVELHILPMLGRTAIRRLRPADLEALYEHKLRPPDGTRPLSPKSVLEIHMIIRGALGDAYRHGLVTRNVAVVANAPKLRELPPVEPNPWTADELHAFLQAAVGHRLFPAFWLAAHTGVRRSELLGLKWRDIDFDKHTMSINRALLSIGYHKTCESRGKTARSRRHIDLGPETLELLRCWKAWRMAIARATGTPFPKWLFAGPDGEPIHPHAFSQAFDRLVSRAGVPPIRLHDVHHTHATLLLREHVTPKVVTERLGHARVAFTLETYQHVLPGMQADAARTFETLTAPKRSSGKHRSTGRSRLKTR